MVEGVKSCLCVLTWHSLLFQHCRVSCVKGAEIKDRYLYVSGED